MRKLHRTIALLLATAVCAAAFAACTASPSSNPPATTDSSEITDTVVESTTEHEAETPFVGLRFDATTRIVVPADAHEIIRNAADMVASAVKEKAGMTLPVIEANADGGADGPALVLAIRSFETERSYALTAEEQALRLEASDPTTLYFATQAVLDAWVTPDFGLATEGVLSLAESRVAELNGLTTRQDTSIRVLSQNIRYKDDANGNSVSERAFRFRQLMMEYCPDLVGTQETTADWNQKFSTMIKYLNRYTDLGEYGMVGCSREGRDATDGEWNTILYRKDRFELLDSDTTWLSYTPNEASAVEGSLCKRICTWALLKDKRTGETVLFANTHLDHGTDEVRSQQMTILMDYLADRIGQYPFYLTGDFNCYTNDPPYATVTERLQDSHKTTWTDLSTETRTYHAYKETGGGEIDFIFHNNHTTPIRYEIISKLYDGYVSDHYGVIAEFVN